MSDTDRTLPRPSGRALTPGQADTIRRRRAAGESGRALAAEFGISEQLVCDIFNGRRYVDRDRDRLIATGDSVIRAAVALTSGKYVPRAVSELDQAVAAWREAKNV